MDLEQLKLILEMAGQAGEGVFALTLIYFVTTFLQSFIIPAAFITFIVIAAKLIRHCVDKCYTFDLNKIKAQKIATLEWYQSRYPTLSEQEAEKALNKALKDAK